MSRWCYFAERVLVTHNTIHDPANLHLQAVLGSRDGNAGVVIAQDDMGEAVIKAADTQMEAEADLRCAAQVERTASETWRSKLELIKWMENMEHQVLGHAQTRVKPLPESWARRKRGGATYDFFTPG